MHLQDVHVHAGLMSPQKIIGFALYTFLPSRNCGLCNGQPHNASTVRINMHTVHMQTLGTISNLSL